MLSVLILCIVLLSVHMLSLTTFKVPAGIELQVVPACLHPKERKSERHGGVVFCKSFQYTSDISCKAVLKLDCAGLLRNHKKDS